MWKKRLSFLISSMIITGCVGTSVQAQIPIIESLQDIQQLLNQTPDNQLKSRCIRLDSRCLFQVASLEGNFSERVDDIESRLNDISSNYFRSQNNNLEIRQEESGNLRNIYVKSNNNEIRLLTVTQPDADLSRVTVEIRTEQIIQQLERGLKQAKKERQSDYLLIQGGIAIGIATAMILGSLLLLRWESKLKESKEKLTPSGRVVDESLTTQLSLRQKWHLKSVQYLLIRIARVTIWAGGTIVILGLFPYTRALQLLILIGIKYPIRLGIAGLSTYVGIRLSYSVIDRFSSSLGTNYVLSQEANQRLQLRINTISGVAKSIIIVTGSIVGILVGLASVGINIAPLLAGAGIIGVAISLGSQNIIRDAINGFCIIVEDQYAIGDVVSIGDFSGLVENINLRITQLRDGEGRLITIPNSEIKSVANMSSQWSRADLNIPIPYYTDVDRALEIIKEVAEKMNHDPDWDQRILETPLVLGVDNFGDRGMIIKVWIKTQPLKQWEVSREFRRRLTIAFDVAGIPLAPPQQEIKVLAVSN